MILSPRGKVIPRPELCPLCCRRRRIHNKAYCAVCEQQNSWPLCERCCIHRRKPSAPCCLACGISQIYTTYPAPGRAMRYSDPVIRAVDAWLADNPAADRAARLQFEQRKFERARNRAIKNLKEK
jgi:hypothetical protein